MKTACAVCLVRLTLRTVFRIAGANMIAVFLLRFTATTHAVGMPSNIQVRETGNGVTEYIISGITFPDGCRVEYPPAPDFERIKQETADMKLLPHIREDVIKERMQQQSEEHDQITMITDECHTTFSRAAGHARAGLRRYRQADHDQPIEVAARPEAGILVLRGFDSPDDLRVVYIYVREILMPRIQMLPWARLLLEGNRAPDHNSAHYRLVYETGWPQGKSIASPVLMNATPLPNGGCDFTFRSTYISDRNLVSQADYQLTLQDHTFLFRRTSAATTIEREHVGAYKPNRHGPIPIRWTHGRQATVELMPYDRLCSHGARYAIVVLNEDNQVLWDAYGFANDQVALVVEDLTRNGHDEIIITETDHGVFQLRVFSSNPLNDPN